MANIAFGSNYFIFSKFSSFPKTSKIEQARASLAKELKDFNEFKSSNELADFLANEKYLASNEFKSLAERTQKSLADEKAKISKYESLKKSKVFKTFFKFKDSQKLKDYNSFSESNDLAHFETLKREVAAPEFAKEKEKLNIALKKIAERESQLASLKKKKAVKSYLNGRAKKDAKSPIPPEVTTYKKLQDETNHAEFKSHKSTSQKHLQSLVEKEKAFNQLKKSRAIKSYFKFQNSQKFKTFVAFEESKDLSNFLQLEEYLNSADHKDLLKKLNQQKEEADAKQKEHDDFKAGKKYKWYEGLKGSNKFDELKKWEVVFEDDFKGAELNAEKWMTRYLWGDKLINDAYALEHDKAFPTDGKNITCGGTLKLTTRNEKCTGKMWKQPFGFLPNEFDYTTGLINTAKSHRQQYGKIEAKIKVDYAKPVNYHFWMTTENNLPHIDILKLQSNKSQVDVGQVFSKSNNQPQQQSGKFKGLDVAQDFFIYSLEWSNNKLTWKINDVVVHEQTQNIPTDSMYIVLNSSITGNPSASGLPATMEVDWIRCYQVR